MYCRYYASLDASGQRIDRSRRPELQLGSVQYLVNEDYCVRDVQVLPIYVTHDTLSFTVIVSSSSTSHDTLSFTVIHC